MSPPVQGSFQNTGDHGVTYAGGMATGDTHRLGYQRVDDDPNVDVLLARTEATQTWTTWDPDESPAPGGCFSMESLADDLVAADLLTTADRPRFVSTIHDAARRGQFSMRLTMFAVVAAAPS